MTRRGYFENQGGKFRLRIVEPGYDADDPNVPGNKVIIDSDAIGTLSVIASGTYVGNNQNQVNGVWIASGWNLPYVPLCTFLFNYGSVDIWSLTIDGSHDTVLRVTNDGIYLDMNNEWPNARLPLRVRWAAYRLPVSP